MEIKIVQETCVTPGCGVAFWLDEKFQARRIEKKDNFFCPNGHSMHYLGESDAQKVTRLSNEKAVLRQQKDAEIERLTRLLLRKKRKSRAKKK